MCDVAYNNVNNWLWTPFIERHNANRIYIEIKFSMRDCNLFPGKTMSHFNVNVNVWISKCKCCCYKCKELQNDVSLYINKEGGSRGGAVKSFLWRTESNLVS